MLRLIILVIAFFYWPFHISLPYLPAGIIVFISLVSQSLTPLLLLPLTSPVLAPIPLLISIVKKSTVHLVISLLLLVLSFPIGQTIFNFGYESRQQIIRDIHLYPNVFLARIYQNKLNIVSAKFVDNLTQILDPNNYFFQNHPREVPDNPNSPKFPYLLIIFFLVGIFSIVYRKSYFIYLLIFSILNLSILTNPYGHDFILWPFICYFIYQGLSFPLLRVERAIGSN
jgi:hypothetical protein